MASRSAKSRSGRRPTIDDEDDAGVGAFLSRHRFAVGGLTAFVVAFSYVTANAVWYQPHAHGGAFFPTRPLPGQWQSAEPAAQGGDETIIRLERAEAAREPAGQTETARAPFVQMPEAAPTPRPAPQPAPVRFGSDDTPALPPLPAPAGDPVVADVQRILAEMNLYSGEIDGLTGPQTRSAIETYRRAVGMTASAEIDDQLLAQLGASPRAESAAPPLPYGSPGTDLIQTASSTPDVPDPMVMRIQAGLKAFGNEGIEIDGVVGERTRAAILEFQALFGLPETGEADQTLYAKMREIGLTE